LSWKNLIRRHVGRIFWGALLKREASVMFDGQFNPLSGTTNCDQTISMMRDRNRRATHGRMIAILDA
jgi:hypothetical protein